MSGTPARCVAPRCARASAAAAVLATVLLGLVAVLAGCGDRPPATATPGVPAASTGSVADGPTGAASSPPAYPACDQTWRADARLPRTYRACRAGDTVVRDRRHSCSSGQVLVVHGGHWYAALGGPVNRVRGEDARSHLRRVVRTCVG